MAIFTTCHRIGDKEEGLLVSSAALGERRGLIGQDHRSGDKEECVLLCTTAVGIKNWNYWSIPRKLWLLGWFIGLSHCSGGKDGVLLVQPLM